MMSVLSNTHVSSNRRKLARDEWLGRRGQLTARQSSGDEPAHVPALVLRNGGETGKRSSLRTDDVRRVSDDKTVRMARNGEIFFNCYGSIRLNVHAEGPR